MGRRGEGSVGEGTSLYLSAMNIITHWCAVTGQQLQGIVHGNKRESAHTGRRSVAGLKHQALERRAVSRALYRH